MILLSSNTLSSVRVGLLKRVSYLPIFVIRENGPFISVISIFSICEQCQNRTVPKHKV